MLFVLGIGFCADSDFTCWRCMHAVRISTATWITVHITEGTVVCSSVDATEAASAPASSLSVNVYFVFMQYSLFFLKVFRVLRRMCGHNILTRLKNRNIECLRVVNACQVCISDTFWDKGYQS